MKFKVGMRTIKTGIGIFFALLICNLLDLGRGTLAAITVVVGMQPSLKSSLKVTKNQILATTIGCIIALLVAYYFYGNILILSFAAIVIIWICLHFGWQDSVTLAIITLLLVGYAPEGDVVNVAKNRVTMIFIGLTVASLLNFIIPPRYSYRLIAKVDELRTCFENFYHKCINDLLRENHLDKEEVKKYTQQIKDLLEEARSIYVLTIESKLGYDEDKERDAYFLIRRSINAIQSNLERLLEIHRSIVLAPRGDKEGEIQRIIFNYLKDIFNYHQKIYDHILFEKPLENRIIDEFSEDQKNLEEKILSLVKEASDLQPLHYYNMVAEGERIMNKAWDLVEQKEQFEIHVNEEGKVSS